MNDFPRLFLMLEDESERLDRFEALLLELGDAVQLVHWRFKLMLLDYNRHSSSSEVFHFIKATQEYEYMQI